MKHFSEYVSLGHPDKIADYISQYILDRYIENDPDTKYAVEVQIKDNHVMLGGEVTSKCGFNTKDIRLFVRDAVNDIGYTKEYQEQWGEGNTICGDDLTVDMLIHQQSKEIARGLTGWGDQGIFFGFATPNQQTFYMGYDHWLAKEICHTLYEKRLGGLDIKTQVVMDDDRITKVIIAIPTLSDSQTRHIEQFVRLYLPHDNGTEIIVNGTGKYVQHSSIADCGTTGRKLAVDFYGGNSKIGGGSPWTKDASKADLTLNLLARDIAIQKAKQFKRDIFVSLACCIGKQEVDMCVSDRENRIIEECVMVFSPQELIERYKLNTPIYASMCKWGLFGSYQQDKIWEFGDADLHE